MKDELDNIFNDMSKEELIDFFRRCGIDAQETGIGYGGYYLEGSEIKII